jgi:hypothetical protein
MKWGDEDWKFEAPTGDAVVVVLEDEPQIAMIITRIVTRRAPRCSVLHCPSSRTFRRALPQLGLGPVPVVTVWSDYNHLGHRGPEDLAFAAGAPSDLAPGGLRLAAAPQVLASGYAREGSKEIPADFRGRAIHKPFAPQVVAEALLAHVQHLLRRPGPTSRRAWARWSEARWPSAPGRWWPRASSGWRG